MQIQPYRSFRTQCVERSKWQLFFFVKKCSQIKGKSPYFVRDLQWWSLLSPLFIETGRKTDVCENFKMFSLHFSLPIYNLVTFSHQSFNKNSASVTHNCDEKENVFFLNFELVAFCILLYPLTNYHCQFCYSFSKEITIAAKSRMKMKICKLCVQFQS